MARILRSRGRERSILSTSGASTRNALRSARRCSQAPMTDKSDAEKKEEGRYDVGENADIRIAMTRHEVHRKQEEKGEERGGRDDHAGPADPVT